MLALDSLKWNELRHAYGSASDIPVLLRALETFPEHANPGDEPYGTLWSSLCHQDTVYSASYTAVPHIIRILASAPTRAAWDFFVLPASIERARIGGPGPEIPAELRAGYFSALERIPTLAAEAAQAEWDELRCRGILAAVAIAKGQCQLGDAILELEADTIKELFERKFG